MLTRFAGAIASRNLQCASRRVLLTCCVCLQGSVMEGAGRKLQGRDAVQFRRAIMRQTGFLENEERFGQSVPG